jgi:hypothetical protein
METEVLYPLKLESARARVCVGLCVCGGKGQLVSQCPLESPPIEGE